MKRLAFFALLMLSVGLLPALGQQPKTQPTKKDDKKKDDKKKDDKKKTASDYDLPEEIKLEEGDKILAGSINLVDAKRGRVIVAVPSGGGHRFIEYKMEKDVQVFGADKQKLDDGMNSDVFKSPLNRLNLSANMVFGPNGTVKAVALTR